MYPRRKRTKTTKLQESEQQAKEEEDDDDNEEVARELIPQTAAGLCPDLLEWTNLNPCNNSECTDHSQHNNTTNVTNSNNNNNLASVEKEEVSNKKKGPQTSGANSSGQWSKVEHKQFMDATQKHGWGNWKMVQQDIPSRNRIQIASHAQKFAKLRPKDLGWTNLGSCCDGNNTECSNHSQNETNANNNNNNFNNDKNNIHNVTNTNNKRVRVITLCNHESSNCNNFALDNGVCQKHGGRYICQHEDNGKRCDKQAKKGGHCQRHGGGSKCKHVDNNGQRVCNTHANKGGYCARHGGVYKCKHVDNGQQCDNYAKKRGYCVRHGGGTKCKHVDNGQPCDKLARIGGYCTMHGGGYKCRHEDNGQRCGNTAKKGGYCITHGGGTKCKHVDNGQPCGKVAREGGYCTTHGGGKKCKHEDKGQPCDKVAQKGGYCTIHGRFRGITRGRSRGITRGIMGIIGGDVNEKFLSQTNDGGDMHEQEPQTKRPKVINIFSGGAGPSTAAVATPNDTTPGSTTAGSARYSTRSGRTPNDTGAASGMPTLPHSELRGRQRGVQRGTVRPPALTDNTIDWAQVNQAEVPDNGYSLIEFNFDGKEMMSDGTTGVIMLKGSIPAAAAPLMSASLRVVCIMISLSFSFSFKFKDVTTLLLLDRGLHVNATVEQDIPARVMIVLSRSFIADNSNSVPPRASMRS